MKLKKDTDEKSGKNEEDALIEHSLQISISVSSAPATWIFGRIWSDLFQICISILFLFFFDLKVKYLILALLVLGSVRYYLQIHDILHK